MDYATLRSWSAGWWRHWPGREPLTLRSRTAVGAYTDYALAVGAEAKVGKFLQPTRAEAAPSLGVYVRADRRVLLPSEALPAGVEPRPGDLIVRPFDESTLTVLSASVGRWELTWRLETRNVALQNGLTVSGVLSRPAAGKDAAGRPALATYATVATVACRVQPEDDRAEPVFERVTIPRRYTAWLATPVAPRAHDRFAAGGATYTVTGFSSPDALDALQSLSLELVP